MPVRVWGGADLLRFEGGIEDPSMLFRRGVVGESLLIVLYRQGGIDRGTRFTCSAPDT